MSLRKHAFVMDLRPKIEISQKALAAVPCVKPQQRLSYRLRDMRKSPFMTLRKPGFKYGSIWLKIKIIRDKIK
jgi:hypothetical protein